ncbi:hypothetical protein BKA70DRAFT_1223229 [Coprinopsis sp. MPI-PUGE-AT-0042]|nr:hypothetical protein BKA70DRAFT_1223229 [Coprinopsis sp. MPI-PUGE-AT-0042]
MTYWALLLRQPPPVAMPQDQSENEISDDGYSRSKDAMSALCNDCLRAVFKPDELTASCCGDIICNFCWTKVDAEEQICDNCGQKKSKVQTRWTGYDIDGPSAARDAKRQELYNNLFTATLQEEAEATNSSLQLLAPVVREQQATHEMLSDTIGSSKSALRMLETGTAAIKDRTAALERQAAALADDNQKKRVTVAALERKIADLTSAVQQGERVLLPNATRFDATLMPQEWISRIKILTTIMSTSHSSASLASSNDIAQFNPTVDAPVEQGATTPMPPGVHLEGNHPVNTLANFEVPDTLPSAEGQHPRPCPAWNHLDDEGGLCTRCEIRIGLNYVNRELERLDQDLSFNHFEGRLLLVERAQIPEDARVTLEDLNLDLNQLATHVQEQVLNASRDVQNVNATAEARLASDIRSLTLRVERFEASERFLNIFMVMFSNVFQQRMSNIADRVEALEVKEETISGLALVRAAGAFERALEYWTHPLGVIASTITANKAHVSAVLLGFIIPLVVRWVDPVALSNLYTLSVTMLAIVLAAERHRHSTCDVVIILLVLHEPAKTFVMTERRSIEAVLEGAEEELKWCKRYGTLPEGDEEGVDAERLSIERDWLARRYRWRGNTFRRRTGADVGDDLGRTSAIPGITAIGHFARLNTVLDSRALGDIARVEKAFKSEPQCLCWCWLEKVAQGRGYLSKIRNRFRQDFEVTSWQDKDGPRLGPSDEIGRLRKNWTSNTCQHQPSRGYLFGTRPYREKRGTRRHVPKSAIRQPSGASREMSNRSVGSTVRKKDVGRVIDETGQDEKYLRRDEKKKRVGEWISLPRSQKDTQGEAKQEILEDRAEVAADPALAGCTSFAVKTDYLRSQTNEYEIYANNKELSYVLVTDQVHVAQRTWVVGFILEQLVMTKPLHARLEIWVSYSRT